MGKVSGTDRKTQGLRVIVVHCYFALQVPRRFSSQQPGKMSYEDFVWFILSEEDKTSDTALEYWFR